MDRTRSAARGRVLTLTAGLVMLALVVADVSTRVLPFTGPTTPRTALVYGSGIAADSLANTQVGGTSCGCPNLRSSFRFEAVDGGELEAIRIYVIAGEEGYAAGTGGVIEASIRTDDGTAAHNPTDEVLGTATVPHEAFPRLEFDPPIQLETGQLYHVVFTNVDPEPTENYVSINSLYVAPPPITPRQAQLTDQAWAQLMDYGDGWRLRPEYTPIMQLEWADGLIDGVGYMESWIGAAKDISGPARARESFVIAGGDLEVERASIRLARRSGDDPLRVRLETVDGVEVAEATIPADTFPLPEDGEDDVRTWATVEFPAPVTLLDRHRYYLVFETEANTTYVVHVIRKGIAVGFEPPTFFPDGVAEFDPGTGWVAFDPGWRGPLAQADLQFYLD